MIKILAHIWIGGSKTLHNAGGAVDHYGWCANGDSDIGAWDVG